MKQFLFTIILVLLFVPAKAQISDGKGMVAEPASLFKTYTNFTATSDDSTGYVTVSVPGFMSDPLFFPVVRLIGIATDSVAADVYVVGRNSKLTSVTSTYSDSIVGTSNTSNVTVITLRAHGTDRLAGCTQFKVGTVFRASGQGTTTGRSLKWYILWKKQ